MARLRVSSGLEVDGYGGAYYRRTAADIDLPGLNSDQVQQPPGLADYLIAFWAVSIDAVCQHAHMRLVDTGPKQPHGLQSARRGSTRSKA